MHCSRSRFLFAVALTVTFLFSGLPSAFAATSGPRYSGPLGSLLATAGVESASGLTVNQAAIPGVPVQLGSLYYLMSTTGSLGEAVLLRPPVETDLGQKTVALFFPANGDPAKSWIVTQTSDSSVESQAVPTPAMAESGITGCDIAAGIIGKIFEAIPGLGELFGAACQTEPGPFNGGRWDWYDPILPQPSFLYYDRTQEWRVAGPVYEIFDVTLHSQRCFPPEVLETFSENPNASMRYKGTSPDLCVDSKYSDPTIGYYPYLTPSWRSDVVWSDGTRSQIYNSSIWTEPAVPNVYHSSDIPNGWTLTVGTINEYWPEYCGVTYAPPAHPREDQYTCMTGQVRTHLATARV